MNLPKYQFHSHSENNLLLFLKTANDHKNELHCDINEYNKLKLLCPLDENFKQKLKTYSENFDDVIEIISDDEKLMDCTDNDLKKEINELAKDLSISGQITKTVDIINGCLTMHEEIPSTLLRDLSNLDNETLEKTFKCLGDTINLEQAEYLWSLIDNSHESIVFCYIKVIFLVKVTGEYKTGISDMFIKFSEIYSSFFLKELTRKYVEGEISEILPKYLIKLKGNFKNELLRNIVTASDKLEYRSIPIIEVLLESGDKTTLTQLLELMCQSAMEFTEDNSYGKLLFGLVNSSKSLISSWEPLLRNILNMNQSIWKIKVQKIISSYLNDTFTSTFS